MTVIRVDKIRKLVFPNKICQPVLRVDPNFQPLFNGYMRIGALIICRRKTNIHNIKDNIEIVFFNGVEKNIFGVETNTIGAEKKNFGAQTDEFILEKNGFEDDFELREGLKEELKDEFKEQLKKQLKKSVHKAINKVMEKKKRSELLPSEDSDTYLSDI